MSNLLTVAILAGGNSSRMGENKALLHIGERRLIEHVIHTTANLSPANVLIIANKPHEYEVFGYHIVADDLPGHGAISGIVTALHHSKTDSVLVLACDLPFVKTDLVAYMVSQLQEGDYQAIIPTVAGYPQGVLAIYQRACLPHFEASIRNGQHKLKLIIETLDRVQYIDETTWKALDPQGISFININTPDNLQSAQELWQQLQDDTPNEQH